MITKHHAKQDGNIGNFTILTGGDWEKCEMGPTGTGNE